MRRGAKQLVIIPCFFGAAMVASSCAVEKRSPVAPGDVPTSVPLTVPTLAVDLYDGGPIHGAIFTTTPNGSIVNANVQYTDKREVYLDGGPRGGSPITAAGLPNGLYVFQITDPPGKVLLSDDASKCRVVRVEGGVIKELVKPADLPAPYGPLSNNFGNGQGAPCHVADSPDGVAGASGRHDTNTDVDFGSAGAIVVQLMPFLDTPNPGGVYKAWITPLKTYVDKGGDLSQQTAAAKVQGKVVGYARDEGFAPPLSKVKTDNFKVKENPPFVRIDKLIDVNGNYVLDANDTPYAVPPGWPVTLTETVEGGTVTNDYHTPTGNIGVPLNSTVMVCERVLSGYKFSYVYVDGQKVSPLATPTTDGEGNPIRCVNVTTGTGNTISVVFGNRVIKPQAKISIAPSNGVNEVEDQHKFTATVQVDPDETGWVNAPDGAEISFTTTGSGAFIPASGKCTTSGGAGSCFVYLTNPNVGLDVVTATVTILGLTRSTDGVAPNSPPGKKYWVDALIAITPQNATNGITEDHTFTATFTAVPGTVPSPTMTFNSLVIVVTAPAGFVKGTDYTESTDCAAPAVNGSVASCKTKINSKKAGTFIANATGKVTIAGTLGGQTVSDVLDRTTDGLFTSSANAYRNSGSATKVYVDGSLSWKKVDGATPPRLLVGATFQVRRTHDRFGVAVTTPNFSVTDNAAPDVDGVGGQFKVIALPLGTYCIEETEAPDGYLLDPTEQCGIVLTLAAPNGVAKPFINSLIGRMTGGTGKVEITEDVYLTSGFTIHCDILLSNNLEINWPNNKWHLDKPIATALCTDEPNVEPGQPDAPFDTFYGTAVGRLNGADGSKIVFTFQDGGEPGKRADQAAIKIWSADGKTVVLDLSLRAIRGNIQAHEDQPHRR